MAKAKYISVADRLGERIVRGDYHIHSLPSERRLADEVGVSTMTARKAVQKLLDDGLLMRQPGGRLQINRRARRKGSLCQLALLVPAFESSEVHAWQSVMTRTAAMNDCSLRRVDYAHWDDPAIQRTLQGFEGVFFLPPTDPPSQAIRDELTGGEHPIVVVDQDWTAFNVPSLRQFPLSAVQLLLDHLYQIGARRIACLNTQPQDPIVLGRIGQWRLWMARHRLTGPLMHKPVEPFADAINAAYEAAGELLAEHSGELDAIMCVTEAAALGTVRAMADRGLQAGRELAVCSTNAHVGRYTTPSITSLSRPDASALVASCMQWMRQASGEPWIGPLMIEPADIDVAVRESTQSWRPR